MKKIFLFICVFLLFQNPLFDEARGSDLSQDNADIENPSGFSSLPAYLMGHHQFLQCLKEDRYICIANLKEKKCESGDVFSAQGYQCTCQAATCLPDDLKCRYPGGSWKCVNPGAVSSGPKPLTSDTFKKTDIIWLNPNSDFMCADHFIQECGGIHGRDHLSHTPAMKAIVGKRGTCPPCDMKSFYYLLSKNFDITLEDIDLLLVKAVENKCFEIISSLVERGANPSAIDNDGRSLLVHAACVPEVLDLLIKSGADASPEILNLTLIEAVKQGCQKEAIAFLIGLGADVNIVDQQGRTLLEHAKGSFDVLRLLIENGANIHDYRDRSFIYDSAALSSRVDFFQFLLDTDVKPDPKLLLSAITYRNLAIAKLLIDRGIGINERDVNNENALSRAIRINGAELVRLLLDRGLSADDIGFRGETMISLAIMQNNLDIVKALIDSGANLNPVDEEPPLFQALMQHHPINIDLITLLIGHGAYVNAVNKHGMTPLLAAVWSRDQAAVRVLLKNGAWINVSDAEGRTPLIAASQVGDAGIVAMLIKNNADVDRLDNQGFSALMHAEAMGFEDVAVILRQAGATMYR